MKKRKRINEKLKQITAKYPKKYQPLFQYGCTGLLRKEEKMHPYLELGFTREDIELLTELVYDEEIMNLSYSEENEGVLFAQVHAVLVLGKLEAEEPFYKLLKGLEIFGEDDDYFRNALIFYLKKVGRAYADVLMTYFLEQKNNIYNRMLVLEALEKIAAQEGNGAIHESFEKALLSYLECENELDDGLNAFAIFALVDITQAKHIGLIRKVFKYKPVDLWYDSDLEDLEIKLGLRKKRETPPPINRFGIPLGGWDDGDDDEYIQKVGRNEPCPCGSGKKYKKCCMK
jgi:hypothetical protein